VRRSGVTFDGAQKMESAFPDFDVTMHLVADLIP
jgi:hypothetical protein